MGSEMWIRDRDIHLPDDTMSLEAADEIRKTTKYKLKRANYLIKKGYTLKQIEDRTGIKVNWEVKTKKADGTLNARREPKARPLWRGKEGEKNVLEVLPNGEKVSLVLDSKSKKPKTFKDKDTGIVWAKIKREVQELWVVKKYLKLEIA